MTACARFDIAGPLRQAPFLAQCAHESQGFTRLVENLNYSAERLLVVFPRYYTLDNYTLYARRPERIANRVYANRMGNGDEASGDGWMYRGRGLFSLTGLDNMVACGEALGLDLAHEPELLEIPSTAALAAGWYWQANGCNALADAGDFQGLTRRINGGLNGFADRLAWLDRAQAALA